MKTALSLKTRELLRRELSAYDAVVITGASSGIGRGFVELMDSVCHIKLCNLSRSFPPYLSDRPNFLHVPCDLEINSEIDEAFIKVSEFLKIPQSGSITLDENGAESSKKFPKILLINNSGFGAYGEFPQPDIKHNCGMIDVNVRALTKLCALFTPALHAGRGSVINIASTAAFQPCPQLSVYAATKAFVKSFTLAFGYEMGKHGCKCLCVCPGPTSSNFFKNAGFDSPPLPGNFGHTPFDVALVSLKSLAKGRPIVVVGLANKLQTLIVKLLPTRLVLSVAGLILSKVRAK